MTAVAPIVAPALELLSQILKWVDEGLSTEEIQQRLADPSGVGRDLIQRIRERREIGRGLLGRDPE
jgi:DNA-binding transcriptional MerR regulator